MKLYRDKKPTEFTVDEMHMIYQKIYQNYKELYGFGDIGSHAMSDFHVYWEAYWDDVGYDYERLLALCKRKKSK